MRRGTTTASIAEPTTEQGAAGFEVRKRTSSAFTVSGTSSLDFVARIRHEDQLSVLKRLGSVVGELGEAGPTLLPSQHHRLRSNMRPVVL